LSLYLIAQLAAGVGLLVLGAAWLVRGAAGIAASFGVPSLIIGLTIVAYGTSAPEMAVSVQAAQSGSAGVALGNVVGSNIFNVLFILGVSSLIIPLSVDKDLLRRDVWIMIVASALMPLAGLDGAVSPLEGVALAGGAALYTLWLIQAARKEPAADTAQDENRLSNTACAALIAGGLAALVLGADWLVAAASEIARAAGVSELVIGLTVIAAGTSLPEVATSVVAAMRGERDIAVGNVVGSNIFNIFAVLGASAALSPSGVAVEAAALTVDIPVMIAAAVACLPIFFTEGRIDRWEGALFLVGYAAYTVWLFLHASQADSRHAFADVVLWVALPVTAAILAVSAWLAHRALSRGQA
jgi:cation:H+ antiporter